MNRFLTTPRHLENKMSSLIELIRSYGRVAIAFSGGVDSTFLAEVCAHALPACDVILLHLDTPLVGTPERRSFERLAHDYSERGVEVVSISLDPLAHPNVLANPADRCYHCKYAELNALVSEARRRGYNTLLEGSNSDDADDYRPGMRAVREIGAQSPLMETDWSKDEERELLRLWGSPVWDLPAGACLATRIPCEEPLTAAKLETVRSCEDCLRAYGLKQVRVRLNAGRAHVSTDAGGLRVLARMPTQIETGRKGSMRSGDWDTPAFEETAAVARPNTITGDGKNRDDRANSTPLPQEIIDDLIARGACSVDPVARLYLHGETSIRR